MEPCSCNSFGISLSVYVPIVLIYRVTIQEQIDGKSAGDEAEINRTGLADVRQKTKAAWAALVRSASMASIETGKSIGNFLNLHRVTIY
jgi:hypothetical protein